MNEMSGLSQIVELFDLRLSLCDAAWEDYLASHPELPHRFATQALLLFQAHGADIHLPSLGDLLGKPGEGAGHPGGA